jgi:hypothetical protein
MAQIGPLGKHLGRGCARLHLLCSNWCSAGRLIWVLSALCMFSLFLIYFLFARPAHLAYWGNHPRAVCILEKHREKLNTWLDACQVSNVVTVFVLHF